MRISLRALLAVVAFAAIASAVLLKPTFFVASATWSLTLLIFGAAIVAAFSSAGQTRAFWAGFACFGCSHLLLSTAPFLDDITGEFIVTRQILDAIGGMLKYKVADYPSMPGIWHNLPWADKQAPTESYGYLCYLMTGQSIFSLIIAYVGGVVGQFFCGRRSTGASKPRS